MKKHAFVALVAFVLLALAIPATAQYTDFDYAFQNTLNAVTSPIRLMGQNLCANSRGTGSGMEASWCHGVVVNPMTGHVEGFNPSSVAGQQARGYGYNNYGHDGRRPSLGRRILNTVLRPNQYGYNGYGAYGVTVVRNDRETPGKCVERATKAFKKAKVAFDPALVMAGCTGSNVPAPPPQSTEQQGMERTSQQAPPVPQSNFPKGVFKDHRKGMLCNNSDSAVAILIDGTVVGQLGAGQQVALASLPAGKIEFQRIN